MGRMVRLVLGIYFILGSCLFAQAPADRTITVTGDGEITVDADKLSFYIKLESQEKELDKAKASNDMLLAKVEEIFKLYSIPENQANISSLSVSPKIVYNSDLYDQIEGYRVSRYITIKLNDISEYEPLVDAIISAGVYRIGGLQYDLSNSAEMHAGAREMALIKARQKAEQMAAVYGMKIGKPLEISEGISYFGGLYSSTSNVARADASSPDTEGFSGKRTFSAQVEVVFELSE